MKCIWVRSNGLCKKIGVLFLLESTFQLSENLLDMEGFFPHGIYCFILKLVVQFLMKKYIPIIIISIRGAPAWMLKNTLAK